ncbi:MAG: HD-GYP domain-containing protein [Pyrinomonadaceae bacterium]
MTSTYTDTPTHERKRLEPFDHLAAAVDDFEGYDTPHAARVAQLCDQIAALFSLASHDRASLRVAALAHDLGEAAMRRDYIKRAGALSEEERQDLARHPVIGEQEAAHAGAERAAQLLVRWHHEWWNGAGYPDALRADQIPLAARILRVADVYASLTKARPFRSARTAEEAHRHLTEGAGLEFDPKVVRAFLSLNLSDEREPNALPEEEFTTPSASRALMSHVAFANNSAPSSFLQEQSGTFSPLADKWLAFDLSVLRRLKFRSVALPFADEPHLGVALRDMGARVAANSTAQSSAIKNAANLVYHEAKLSEAEVETTLADAYVPGYALHNQDLSKWFREVDAWWFDNVRANINRLETEAARTQALSIGLMVGDYVRSFDAETRVLRQPLSKVFQRLWSAQQAHAANRAPSGSSHHREARDFIAEQHNSDLLFLRLPRAQNVWEAQRDPHCAWRESWVSGENEIKEKAAIKGATPSSLRIESKGQYLRFVEEILGTALHIERWAIAHVEDGFVSTAEMVETISRLRKVETIYTKDFSELMGARATIIAA